MVWTLVAPEREASELWLPVPKLYLLGRGVGEECDIVLNEKFISRKHAEIRVDPLEGNGESKPKIWFKDLSKFGTHLDGKKVVTKDFIALQDGSVIRFSKNLEYQVKWLPTIFCCSNLRLKEKALVAKQISKIGGKLLDDLEPQCTHLVMVQISLTPKLLLAMIDQKEIVSTSWLEALANAKTCEPFRCSSYRPLMSEDDDDVSLLEPDSKRRTLFINRRFIFLLSDQLDKASMIVKKAGGTADLVETSQLLAFLTKLSVATLRGLVIVNPNLTEEDEEVESVLEQVDQLGLTRVNEEAIGFAILKTDVSEHVPVASETKISTAKKAIAASKRSPVTSPTPPALPAKRAPRYTLPPVSPPASSPKPTTTAVSTSSTTASTLPPTSPSKSPTRVSKLKMILQNPDQPASPKRSPPRLPMRGELLFQRKKPIPPSTPSSSDLPKAVVLHMVVEEASLIARSPVGLNSKRFRRTNEEEARSRRGEEEEEASPPSKRIATDRPAVNMVAHDEYAGAKKDWLDRAHEEGVNTEKESRMADELFDARPMQFRLSTGSARGGSGGVGRKR